MTLTNYMTQNELSDSDLAAMIGVSATAICRYRTGKRRPRWNILQKIVEVTGGEVTPADFFEVVE